MSKKPKIILIVAAITLFIWLPITPVNVVPEVTLRVMGVSGKPIAGIAVFQDWQHWTFESQQHRDEILSDEIGYVTFPEKRIWVSAFTLFFWSLFEKTVGNIMIHNSFGPSNGFGIEGYKTENRWCYPDRACGSRERTNEIIILEKYQP